MVFSVAFTCPCVFVAIFYAKVYTNLPFYERYGWAVHQNISIYLTIKQSKRLLWYGVWKHYVVVVAFTELDMTYSPDSLKYERVKT